MSGEVQCPKGCGAMTYTFTASWVCASCEERRSREEIRNRNERAAIDIFCPECGSLVFPGPDREVKCPNYGCGYDNTPANRKEPGITLAPIRDLKLDNETVNGEEEEPSTDKNSYKKNCDYCRESIWMQYREESNDWIPLDFGNGGKMNPHRCR